MTGPGSELAANAGQPRRKGWIRGRVSALEAAYEGYWINEEIRLLLCRSVCFASHCVFFRL